MMNYGIKPGLIGLFLSIALLCSTNAPAAKIEGVHFADKIETPEGTLQLKGVALLRYLVFIKAYVGALYLPEAIENPSVLEDVPKQFVIEYFHTIKKEQFTDATLKALKNIATPELYEKQRSRIDLFVNAYKDVAKGDRYYLRYSPESGIRLFLNEKELIVIKDPEFAALVFSIWLGPESIDQDFTKQILKPL